MYITIDINIIVYYYVWGITFKFNIWHILGNPIRSCKAIPNDCQIFNIDKLAFSLNFAHFNFNLISMHLNTNSGI